MKHVYTFAKTMAPYLLMWVWTVNYVPEGEYLGVGLVYALLLFTDLYSYYNGVRRGVEIGNVVGGVVFSKFADAIDRRIKLKYGTDAEIVKEVMQGDLK